MPAYCQLRKKEQREPLRKTPAQNNTLCVLRTTADRLDLADGRESASFVLKEAQTDNHTKSV